MQIMSTDVPRGGAEGPLHAVAMLLRSRRTEILHDCENRLWDLGSPLVRDAASRQMYLACADATLDNIIRVLANDQQLAQSTSGWTTACQQSPTAGEVWPDESFTAAGVLLDVVMDAIREFFRANEQPGSAGARAVSGADESPQPPIGHPADIVRQARADERRRIARDLHDRIGQGVAVAVQNLEVCLAYAEKDATQAGPRISVAREALRSVIDNIHGLASDLRLTQPHEGLGQALRSYVGSIPTEGVEVTVKVNGDEGAAPPLVTDEALLVIQEAFRNAVMHGRPRSVLAQVDISAQELRATVDDDGVGIDPGAVDQRASDCGGLDCMRERAHLLGGTLAISPRQPTGTRVELRVPLGRPAWP